MIKRTIRLCAALLCAGLSACGPNTDIKEALGLNHKGPDAMQVYSRPPLTVPPDFDLQTPGKGPEYSVGVPTDVQAHNDILGTNATAPASGAALGTASTALPSTNILGTLSGPASTAVPAVSASPLPSNGDAQFLANIGAAKADPNIREEIEKEKPVQKDDHYLIDTKPTADPTVDASKEAQRLKQDKTQDKPPTTGDTPVITPQDKGLLGGIF